jgi:hypothetical protein
VARWEGQALRSAKHIGELALFGLVCLPAGVAIGSALWQVPSAMAESPFSLDWIRLFASRAAG